jgi:arginase family enzyme
MKILNCPTSQGSFGANKGCEKAPSLICPEAEIINLPQDNIEETNKILENSDGDFFIGGDHSITYPLFKSFARKHKNPCLVIFDAHADCSDDFMPPTHEDFNKVLINQGILKPENLFLIGLRKIYDHEREFLNERGIKYIEMNKIGTVQELLKRVKEFAKEKELYLSIDIDVLDKEFAPGTGYVEESKGMSLDYLIEVLNEIKVLMKKGDLVEINPDKDVDGKTVNSAERILSALRHPQTF